MFNDRQTTALFSWGFAIVNSKLLKHRKDDPNEYLEFIETENFKGYWVVKTPHPKTKVLVWFHGTPSCPHR
jgi:hypothetical protein